MLPLLEAISDGQVHTLSDLYDKVAERLKVSPEDRRDLLPSGRQSRFENRVAWAKTYLKHAGLIETPQRAACRITSRGQELLKRRPDKINIALLMQFPEFVAFRARSEPSVKEVKEMSAEQATEKGTPEEVLEASYQRLREELAEEILDRIMEATPSFFEKLVVELLLRMGYGGSRKDAGQAIGQGGDAGIDGIINEDRLGLDVIYVQAKKWDRNRTVGRPEVQAFAGSLEGQRARKGIFITTSQFSSDAREYVQRIEKKIVLINGELLADLMIEHGLGVTTVATYDVKKIDSDFFAEE